MKKKQKLAWLFGSLIFFGTLLLLVFVFSLMPYTVLEPVSAWQKFVEFCQEVIDVILVNKIILAIIVVAIFGGGYFYIVKTSKK